MSAARSSRWPVALAVCGSTGAGALVALSPTVSQRVPAAIVQLLVGVVAALVFLASLRVSTRRLRKGEGPERLGSAVLAAGILIAVLLPGVQLLLGLRESLLSELGLESTNVAGDVIRAEILFLLALLAFAAGEMLQAGTGARIKPSPGPVAAAIDSRYAYLTLVAVGIAIAWLVPIGDQQEAFSTRGEAEGEGAVALLRWAFPLAVTLGILKRHWGSRALVAVSVALLAYDTVALGNRSPLLLVGIAVLLRLLDAFARPGPRFRVVALALVCVYLGAAAAVGVASWRGDVIEGERTSITAEIGGALVNPFSRLTEAGLDTLDGLILATKIDPEAIGAGPADLTKVVTGFIPHQVWPEKPEWLGNELTELYLGISGGGLFISGPGYTLVIFGGALGMAAAFLALGAAAGRVYRRVEPTSAAAALLTYFLARFFFGGGDAFDAFHVIGLSLLLVAAAGVGRGLRAIFEVPSPRLSPGR